MPSEILPAAERLLDRNAEAARPPPGLVVRLKQAWRGLRASSAGHPVAAPPFAEVSPTPPPATQPPPTLPQAAEEPVIAALPDANEEADRWAEREMQQTALRSLPLLLNEIVLGPATLRVSGYAGTADRLDAGMAIFVNGLAFDQVTYPIYHSEVAARFAQAEGMGGLIDAAITHQLDALRAARFWRFDLAADGCCRPHRWRQAMHLMNPACERFPLPPASYMQRVIGDADPTRFAMGGSTLFKNIENWLHERGRDWNEFTQVLDWGCGAGRLSRYLIGETGASVTGIDIDDTAIAWCRDNLVGGHFQTVGLHAPTGLPGAGFDLVVSVSVLTHLDREQQDAWLAEMHRLTRPGGLLFLSVRGPTQLAYMDMPGAIYRRLQVEGFLDLAADPALDGCIPDKEYYRSVFHSRRHILENWSRWFEVLAIEDGIAALQDFVVLRRA